MSNLKYFLHFIFCFLLLPIIKCQSQGAGRWIAKNEFGESFNENDRKLDSTLNMETLDNIVLPNAIGWSPENEVI